MVFHDLATVAQLLGSLCGLTLNYEIFVNLRAQLSAFQLVEVQ